MRAPPVGVLTAQDRDTWASVRARQPSPFARYAARKGAFTAAYLCCAPMGQDYATLRGSEGGPNAAALDRLASASLLLCLDDAAPRTEAEMGRLLLHGSPHDRWWDKTMQLVVTDSGRAGVIGEVWGSLPPPADPQVHRRALIAPPHARCSTPCRTACPRRRGATQCWRRWRADAWTTGTEMRAHPSPHPRHCPWSCLRPHIAPLLAPPPLMWTPLRATTFAAKTTRPMGRTQSKP